MKVCRQLSVFLENKPGTLARVSGALAVSGINIVAFSISDAVDHGVLRMVVSNPIQAAHLLGDGGMMVVESDVLALDLPNRPGALARLAEKLSKARVNIEYAYGTTGGTGGKAQVIFKVDHVERARKALGRK
ncbi:MAG: ACT domain-containing protein [Candidatus Binatota bacterium]